MFTNAPLEAEEARERIGAGVSAAGRVWDYVGLVVELSLVDLGQEVTGDSTA